MTLEMAPIRRVLLVGALALGAFTLIPRLTAAQTGSSVLLVTTKGDNSLTIIDPVSGNILGVVPVGRHPHNVAASTDGKLAFVTNQTAGSISVIDIAARKELRRVDLGPGSRPHGIYYAAGKVYFTADGYKEIGCYDPESNQIEWRLGTGQSAEDGMLVVTKDAQKIFASNNRSATVTALQRVVERGPAPWGGPAWDITLIPVGAEPMGIDISPDGKEVWTARQSDGAVAIIDVATLKTIRILPPQAKRSNRLTFTPDGKYVLLVDTIEHDVIVFDAKAHNPGVIKRLKLVASPGSMVVEPDSSRAYVSLPEESKVSIIDLKTLEVMPRLISTGQLSGAPIHSTVPGNHFESGPFPEGMAWSETR